MSSWASSDGGRGSKRSKYSPVTPSTSGETARYVSARPPSSGESIRRLATARNGRAYHGARDQMSVATLPGCTALTVTPNGASSAASDRAYSTLASLEREYARMIEYPCS